jgi:hypothetical protein
MIEFFGLAVLLLVLLLGSLGLLGAILMPRTPLASHRQPGTKKTYAKADKATAQRRQNPNLFGG